MADTDQQMTLAPGAGSGVGKLVASELLSRAGIIKKLADAFEAALTATRRTWDSGAKQWVEEPDTRSQLQAAFGLLAHMEGEPIKRVVHEFKRAGLDPLAALDSPAAIEAAERMIAGAKAHARKTAAQARKAEPVVVDVE